MTSAAIHQPDEFIDQCLSNLRALKFVKSADLVARLKDDEPSLDARLALVTAEGKHVLPCEIHRTHLRRENAQLLIHIAKRHPGLMIFAPTVGRELGDVFEKAGVNFVDVVGNCNVNLGDRYFVRVQGRTASEMTRKDRGLRAPAYRVLLALLVRPELLNASSRAIAAEADVSPQTANELRQWLAKQSLILAGRGRRRWAAKQQKEAMALWLAGYTTTLAPSLTIGRYRAMEPDATEFEKRVEPLLDATCEWRYGGAAAAMRLTNYYRGDRTVLYVRAAPPDLWSRLRLVRDASGPISLRNVPGRPAFDSPDPRCVHPLLAYADLLAEGHDRAREAAGELYARFLAPETESS